MESRTDGPAAPREQEAAGRGRRPWASWRARAWQEAPASLVRVLLPRPLVNRRPPPPQTWRGSNPSRVRTVLWHCQRTPGVRVSRASSPARRGRQNWGCGARCRDARRARGCGALPARGAAARGPGPPGSANEHS